MSILCELTGHRASENRIRNAGHHFARCTRCNADLVERESRWTTAPKGYRIIWRAAEQEPLELTVEALQLEAPEPEAPEPVALQPVEAEEGSWPVFNVARAIEAMPEPEPEPEPLELIAEPAVAEAPERRRSRDRRAPPGTQPKFTGVDRRRGDRRADFGKKPFEPKRRSAPVAQA